MNQSKYLAVQGLLVAIHVAVILLLVVFIGPEIVRRNHLGPDDIAAPAQFVLAGQLAMLSIVIHLLVAGVSLVKQFTAGIVLIIGIIVADAVVSGMALWLVVVRVIEISSSGRVS